MDMHPQVGHGSFTHLLLMSDRADDELAALLLNDRPRRRFRFLRVGLAVDAVPVEP